jgi:hypothetical protein
MDFSNSDGDMNWIDVAQDRDRWMTIMNFKFHKMLMIS